MIRDATQADLPLVRELFREFMLELEDAPHRDDDTEQDLAKLESGMTKGWHVLIAEHDDMPAGLAAAEKAGAHVGYLSSLYVRPAARARIAKKLKREIASRVRAQAGARARRARVELGGVGTSASAGHPVQRSISRTDRRP